MKVVIAILIFISAAEAIRNLVGLPEERLSRLHNLLKGNYNSAVIVNSGYLIQPLETVGVGQCLSRSI